MNIISALSFLKDNWTWIVGIVVLLVGAGVLIYVKTAMGWVKGNLQIITVAVVAAVLAGSFMYFRHTFDEVDKLKADNAQLQENNKALTQANVNLQDGINKQNLAIQQLAMSMGTLSSNFLMLNNTINRQVPLITTGVADILNGPKPTDCKAAIDYLIEAARQGQLQPAPAPVSPVVKTFPPEHPTEHPTGSVQEH